MSSSLLKEGGSTQAKAQMTSITTKKERKNILMSKMTKTHYLPKERASEQLTIWIIQIFYLLNEMPDLNKKKTRKLTCMRERT